MVLFVLFLGLIGLAMGSFIDALVWRLRTGRDFVTGRSECEHCHHKLKVLDLIPVLSWVMLKGRCRYCRAKINWQSPVIELSMTLLFIASYFVWPFGFATSQAMLLFAIWLIEVVILGALFVYDLRWQLLPDKLTFPLIALGLFDAGVRLTLIGGNYFVNVAGGVLLIAGLYALLHFFSKGKWVGFGDVKLNIFIGAVLGWKKSLLALMLANVIGFLYVLPGLLTGKLSRKSRVPFGPFLIIGFVLANLFGDIILQWYLSDMLML